MYSMFLRATALLACATCLPVGAAGLERIVVTATRQPADALRTPASLSSIDGEGIALLGPTHHAEILNRSAGTLIQRGSGQESLTAIRSPVLTGAGACGAFLFLENGVPIRPVGFCNVNEMFELNTEQAASIEVLRGPGTALYGSNAVHGTVNVLQAAPTLRPPLALGLDLGPDAYRRGRLQAGHGGERFATGVAGLYTHDGGWRDDSGFDEAKFNLSLADDGAAQPWQADFAATWLDQQTAGFIVGKNSYADEQLARSNPNPEAFREAHALRLTGKTNLDIGAMQLELRPYLRSSRMEFLQHFLLGQPLERNGQESGGLMSTAYWSGADWTLIAGVDLELAQSFLLETQENPTTGGSPAANAIRPAGRHYDYAVDSRVAAVYAQYERRLAQRWTLVAGLRAESVHYDYDNQMIDGNTDEHGVPCAIGGCLFSRPADRDDSFEDLAPKLALSYDFGSADRGYVAWSHGFRPPEMTELYRLQRQQSVAGLDSEQIDAVELGLKGARPHWQYAIAVFDLRKRNVILRESNGFNVADGRSTHQGLEYELTLAPFDWLEFSAAGTRARHRYGFSRAIEGGETITDGNDIDTAPRNLHNLRLRLRPTTTVVAEAEWLSVGEYWLDAANLHRYGGYELLNLRAAWNPASQWRLSARVVNALDRDYADRADYAFGNYRYFPGRGRAVFVALDWSLPN